MMLDCAIEDGPEKREEVRVGELMRRDDIFLDTQKPKIKFHTLWTVQPTREGTISPTPGYEELPTTPLSTTAFFTPTAFSPPFATLTQHTHLLLMRRDDIFSTNKFPLPPHITIIPQVVSCPDSIRWVTPPLLLLRNYGIIYYIYSR